MVKFLCVLVWILVSTLASAQNIVVVGKNTSKITARVVHTNNLIVTDDQGGWFDNGLKMMQLGGWTTPYEVQARLKVVSTTGMFQVRLDSPLVIAHQSKPSLVFRNPAVKLGNEGETPKLLAVGSNTQFRNPMPSTQGVDSVGYYELDVAAYPPEGTLEEVGGTYSGVLSMIFEPVIDMPKS
ncbi:hypothetical protein [Burkholderia plantarii]|uniref:hypothetical protein n=1 Tax=Burkholderia plantarii TaxID=41899 RepID=UPI0005AEE8C1|nr:hypothetical protein [Burkholderia plantarii]ALK33392.1 hypothetical protein bpln_2g11510 [Burkholderia plantarii]WLE62451.1 hypothetical protein GIY62_34290 [Burkholderia plantarii]GLZ16555.1 hypothetical protein Bpla01_00850 [Burkholderia plantarii]